MARVDLGWQGGKRRFKAIYGRSRKAVAVALHDALKAAQEGSLVTDERQTVSDFLARWLHDVARTRVRPRTFAGYEATITHHIAPHIGRVRLTKLTPQHLQAWMASLKEDGVSVGRRRYARVVLRMALNTAIRWRLVTVNAATLIDAPRSDSREIRPLSPDECKGIAGRLLVSIRSKRLLRSPSAAVFGSARHSACDGRMWISTPATLQVRRAVQRFGGDAAARRPLLAERKRLRADLKARHVTQTPPETRSRLVAELQAVRAAFERHEDSVQFTELKSARSRRDDRIARRGRYGAEGAPEASARGTTRCRPTWREIGASCSPARSERP